MNQVDLGELNAMLQHVSGLDEDLQPSGYWEKFGRANVEMLMQYGIENFKRTVNQNYFNWIPFSASDNQYRRVEAYWEAHPDPAVLQAEVEDWELLFMGFYGENPFADPAKRSCYARYVGMLWHHVRHGTPNGILDRLAEPELGNPIRTRLGRRLISQDLANSAKELNTIFDSYDGAATPSRPLTVGELGAGYGRVAQVLLATRPARYIVIDLPPALFVSQWYLSRLFPERRIFRFRPFRGYQEVAGELAAAEIAFLTPDELYLLPDGYFDVFLTISSLAEMTPSQVAQYLGLMCCKTKSRIYIKQWREWTNRVDWRTTNRADYDLPAGWHKRIDRVDSVQDLFFETLWEAD